MKLAKFRFGGIHPHDNKHAAGIHSEVLPLPKSVLITSSQHFGAPAKIVKQKGDTVEKGELIAEAGAGLSAMVHSSVSGKISSIEIAASPLGRNAHACLIDVAESNNKKYDNIKSHTSLSAEETIAKIRAAGIVGLGGAMFPADGKINTAIKTNCDVLVINGVECEPYITSDYRIMLEHTEEIFTAIEIFRKVIPSIKRVVIGIENNKPLAISEMSKMAKNYDVEVMPLRLQYPQGAEKMLIDATTGRVVPLAKLPLDVGVLVSNVATMYSIYEAVCKDKPLIERLVTVTGDAIKENKNLWVPIGTRVQDIVDYCGGITSDNVSVIAGGPMMGFTLPNLEQATVKGTGSILVIDENKRKKEHTYPCIGCNRCVDVCPMRLLPRVIAHAGKAQDKEKMNKFDIGGCFECGCCTYVCSSKIHLVQWIRIGKDYLRR